MQILLVEDDDVIAQFIQKGLTQSGFKVHHCGSAEDALLAAAKNHFDAMVVDVMLPGTDGLAFVERVRSNQETWVPVLILSAKQGVDDRVRGLHAGGDDYLTKPFALSELLARLQSLTRRKAGQAEEKTLSACGIHIDLLARKASRNGRVITLPPLEFTLLAYLIRHAGQVLSRAMVIEHVWNCEFDSNSNVVEVRISSLREKLHAPGESEVIHTVRGAGYVLRERP